MRDRLGRQALPDDPGTRAGSWTGRSARCTGTCGEVVSSVLPNAVAGAVGRRRLGVHEQQDVERDPELRRQRVQRVDRRLGAPGLDLGDQARRHADRPRPGARRLSPRARRASRSRSPISAYSGSGRCRCGRSTPTRLSLACCWPVHRYLSRCCARVAPAPRCVALVNGANRARVTAEPAGKDPDEDVRVAGSDDRRLGGAGQPRPPPLVPLRPRQGRARRVRPRLDAAVRLQQHPLRHEHPHRRVGARQDDPLRAPDARRRRRTSGTSGRRPSTTG